MSQALMNKAGNFLGFEELENPEYKEIKSLREEVKSGKYSNFEEVFAE